VIPIVAMIRSAGYESTLIRYGIGQGLVVFALAWFLRARGAGFMATTKPSSRQTSTSIREYSPVGATGKLQRIGLAAKLGLT
jgi:OFA family oxalate/formate antiporter-like MFS transporter